MLSIDVGNEAQKESREREDREAARQREANAASAWSLGLSVLGVALGLGPVGYAAGKIAGRYGADWWGPGSDWEKDEVSEGKFHKEDSRRYNRAMKQAAKDQTVAQAIGTVTDLATMYVQTGGLEEGFDPSIGGGDWTTFGTGGVEGGEWAMYPRGEKTVSTWVEGIPNEGGGTLSEYQDLINPDYVPGFIEGYKPLLTLKGAIGKEVKNLSPLGKKISDAD